MWVKRAPGVGVIRYMGLYKQITTSITQITLTWRIPNYRNPRTMVTTIKKIASNWSHIIIYSNAIISYTRIPADTPTVLSSMGPFTNKDLLNQHISYICKYIHRNYKIWLSINALTSAGLSWIDIEIRTWMSNNIIWKWVVVFDYSCPTFVKREYLFIHFKWFPGLFHQCNYISGSVIVSVCLSICLPLCLFDNLSMCPLKCRWLLIYSGPI